MLPYRDSHFVRITLIIFFVLAIGYGFFEARGMLFGPVINIPSEVMTVREPFTSIRGRADRINELRLNGKTISVTEEGYFEETFLLAEGSNRMVLEANDARGRTTREVLDIVYIP